MNRQTITVDLSPGKDPIKRLSVTQGDTGRPLGVYIKQDGAAFDLTDYSVELYVLKPDGNYYYAEVEVDSDESNLVVWDTAEQETILAGDCEAQIRVVDGSVNVGTAEFIEYVEKSPNAMGINSETILSDIQIGNLPVIVSLAAQGKTIISTSTTKSGYYPVGIVGAYTSDTNIIVSGARITSRSSGSVSMSVSIYNAGDSAVSMRVVNVDILWMKV